MTDQVENQLIAELSRKIVIEIAPEERRAFNAISEAYFKDPQKTLKGDGGGDALLGFGIGEITLLLTPIILEVIKEVLKDLLKDTITQKSPTLLEKLRIFVERLFGVNSLQSTPPQSGQLLSPLSQEQLSQARQRACESAIQLGVDGNKASLIADSVVASLQLSL